MRLSEINQKDIIYNFSSLKNFNSQIDESVKSLHNLEDQLIMRDIKHYYNLIFEDESICMVTDIQNHLHIVRYYLIQLKRLFKTFKLFIFDYMHTRISENLLFTQNVRKLA